MKSNIVTASFSAEVESQVVSIIKKIDGFADSKQATKLLMRLGFDLFESEYYASQSESAKRPDFKLTRAKWNSKTGRSIWPKFK